MTRREELFWNYSDFETSKSCQVPSRATEHAILWQNTDTDCMNVTEYQALCDKEADFPRWKQDRMYKNSITLPIPIRSTFIPLSALNETSVNQESAQ